MVSNATPFMFTFTGRFVNPLNVRPEDVRLRDIAHHLSIINRFNGATKRPIPVAQHAVYVSRLLDGTGFEWDGLHHDDGEAYVGDMTKWLKKSDAMKAFRDAEEIAQESCYTAFRIERARYENYPDQMNPLVKHADKLMVRFEGLRGYGRQKWTRWCEAIGYDLLTTSEIDKIGAWSPWSASASEEAFITRARTLYADGLAPPGYVFDVA
jgi:5'-deoxynucleotidase YfbR-like HD superfamily hydrolase